MCPGLQLHSLGAVSLSASRRWDHPWGSLADLIQVWKAFQRPVNTVGWMALHGESTAALSLFAPLDLFALLPFSTHFLSDDYAPPSFTFPPFLTLKSAHLNRSNKGCRFRLIVCGSCRRPSLLHMYTKLSCVAKQFISVFPLLLHHWIRKEASPGFQVWKLAATFLQTNMLSFRKL